MIRTLGIPRLLFPLAALAAALNDAGAQSAADSIVGTQPLAMISSHNAGVTAVKFSPDGNVLATADLAGVIDLHRAGSWTKLRELKHGSEVYALAFSKDGKLLASSGGDGRVVIWDVATGNRLRAVANEHRALAIDFSPGGDLLIGGEDGLVRFIDPANGGERRELHTNGPIWSLAVSRDGKLLATGLPLRVWSSETLALRYKPTTLGQLGVAFSADASRLASAESVGGAVLWTLGDTLTFVPLRAIVERHANGPRGSEAFNVNMPVASIDLSASGARAVGGSTSGDVYLWTVLPGSSSPPTPVRLKGHTMSVVAVALSPDGKLIASGSLDRTVRIWRPTPE